jgi:hypothetical protein
MATKAIASVGAIDETATEKPSRQPKATRAEIETAKREQLKALDEVATR